MKIKKMISWGLTFAMAASMSLAVPIASFADPTDEWDDSTSYYDTTWYSSSGTTFNLTDEADLAGFAYLVNSGTSFANKTVNIKTGTYDLSAHKWVPVGNATITSSSSTNNSPVASGNGFAGTLDGNGASITGMYVTQATDRGAGFFGYIAPTGKVFDLRIDGEVSGSDDAVGGVAGYNSGLISGVTSDVEVTSSSYNVGGIAGFNDNYYVTGSVGLISKCVNTGAVTGNQKVGGIVGENAGTISRCSNSARIIGSNTSSKNGVGGIAGRNGNNDTARETGYIVNCYNTGTVGSSGQKWVGCITGFNNSKSYVSTCYSNVSVVQGSSFYNTIVGKQEGTSQYNYYVSDNNVTYAHSGSSDGEIGMPSTAASLAANLNAHSRALTSDDSSTDAIWATATTPPAVLTSAADWFLSHAIASSDTNSYTNSCSVIYLQNGASSDFDVSGNPTSVTVGDPYIAARLAAESTNSACYVSVLNTIVINSEINPIFDNVIFKWGASGSGPMFEINSGGTLIMAAKEVDGNNTCTTLFDVNGTGTLKLRGNVETTGTSTSVDLASGASFILSKAKIGGKVLLNNTSAIDCYFTMTNLVEDTVYVQFASASVGNRAAITSESENASKLRIYGSTTSSFTAVSAGTNTYYLVVTSL